MESFKETDAIPQASAADANTKDKVMDQDGGAMYALMNSYPLVVAKDFVPFDNLGLWPELKGEGASSLKRMISELYVDFESVVSVPFRGYRRIEPYPSQNLILFSFQGANPSDLRDNHLH